MSIVDKYRLDGHTVRTRIDPMAERVVLDFNCPGKTNGCTANFACPDCEGTGENDECSCGGTGLDAAHHGDCYLTADGGAKEFGWLCEFYDGTDQPINDGDPIGWTADYFEWGWILAKQVSDDPNVIERRVG